MLKHAMFKSALVAFACSASLCAYALADGHRQINVPAGELITALKALAQQSGVELVYRSEQLEGLRTRGVTGSLSAEDAVRKLLEGTPLTLRMDSSGAMLIALPTPTAPKSTSPSTGSPGNPAGAAQATDAEKGAQKKSFWDRFRLAQASEPSPSRGEGKGEDQRTGEAEQGSHRRPVQLDEVLVTGSRIRRSAAAAEGPSPVTILTRNAIDRTGRATVADVLQQLPQNFGGRNEGNSSSGTSSPARIAPGVDLRGLGAENTLLLVNGRRIAPSAAGATPLVGVSYVNLNAIPLAAVERIEILTDGASALYGSDAVAGVVNIILKDKFSGTDLSARYGNTSASDAAERELTLATGLEHGKLNMLLSVDYFERNALSNVDRAFSESADLTRFGGTDYSSFVTFANPGNVIDITGAGLPGLNGAPFAAIPAGQNGQNLTPADFQATAGQQRTTDTQKWGALIPEAQRWGISSRLALELTDRTTAYGEAGWSRDKSELPAPPPISGMIVPETNPFNPFGVPVAVTWLYETGPLQTSSDSESWHVVAGARGRLRETWNWDSGVSYSRDEVELRSPNQRDPVGEAAALNRTDPATALNVFGDGTGVNSPDVLAGIIATQTIAGDGDIWSWDAKFDGLLTHIAGRELRAAAGVEYRKEQFDSHSVFPTIPSTASFNIPASGSRHLESVFAELALPVFTGENAMPGFHALEFQLAARGERYSDFGSSFNPKVALRWQPVEAVMLRASWGSAFRAPALFQLYRQPLQQDNQQVLDPVTGQLPFVTLVTGGNRDLDAEDSTTLSLGVLIEVPFIAGLSIGADHYEIEDEGRIVQPDINALIENASLFPSRVIRDGSGALTFIDDTFLNVGRIAIRGTDVRLEYRRETDIGTFDLSANGAQVDSVRRQLVSGAPVEQLVNTSGNPLSFRATGSLFWSHAGWEAGVTERYLNSYEDSFIGRTIDSGSETDVQLSYSFAIDTKVTLGVDNIFDETPPFRNLQPGYDPTYYSPRMRFFYVTLRKGF